MSRPQYILKFVVITLAYALTIFAIAASFLFVPNQVDTISWVRTLIIIFASTLLAKYFFYMIVSPLETLRVFFARLHWRAERPYYYPRVSVIVPAWNEEVGIVSTVRSLMRSTYDNLEVVVVNDGSVDNTEAMVLQFAELFASKTKHSNTAKKIIYAAQPNSGKGAALNRAIAHSSGDIIISIDGDCIADKHAIRNFVEYFRDESVMAAVGNVKIANVHTLIGTIQSLEFLFSFYFKKADSLLNTIYIVGGAAGAFRREVFTKLGGYNTTNITEDIELSMRIQDAGMRIVYASDAIVYTEGASDLAGLKKQRLRWKRGRFETFYAYMHMFLSAHPRHNKFLSFLVLPLALFAEIQLLFEIPFVVFLYFYSFVATDFSSFISGIIVVSSMFFFLMIFEDKSTRRFSFYILAPIGWCLFYVMTYVEATALLRSVFGFITKEEVQWQKWKRTGIQA